MMKNRKIFKSMKKQALDYLLSVPDENISSVRGLQDTMNDFLQLQGLPPVSIFPSSDRDRVPETRSFDDVLSDLSDST